ncbi:MAG TPA: hypothetical protein VK059_00105, partial [Nocardioidaceae bacterium]|nr:hypothetical protein [Nocardioidaceae bacterium]
SGRELWSRDYPAGQVATVAGVDSRGVVITQGKPVTDPDPDATFRTSVSRWDLRSGEDAGVVGRIDDEDRSSGASVWSVADGMLYRAHHDPTTAAEIGAYELPDADPDRTAPEALEWADGDVQPDPFADPCTAVRPATLRQLGLQRSVELPAPADCVWKENEQPDRSDRALSVDLIIAEPTGTGDDDGASDSPAVENAKALVKQRRDGFRTGFSGAIYEPPMREPYALDGVADEAYGSAAEWPHSTGAYLLVRQGNVVLEVQAEGAHDRNASRGAGQASLPDTEAGVMAAAEDVFGELELEFAAPEAPDDDGRFERVKAVCDALSDDIAALGLPDPVSMMPRGSDARVARCASAENRDYGAELEVYAYAAAASPLTEKTGKEAARAVYSNATGTSDRPISTLGDNAAVYRDDSEYGGMSNSNRRVTTRRGNLVVQIDYSRWGAGIGPQMERDAIGMARKLIHVAAQESK